MKSWVMNWRDCSLHQRTLVLAEDWSLIASTHTMTHNHLQLQFQGFWCSLLTYVGIRKHIYVCMCVFLSWVAQKKGFKT